MKAPRDPMKQGRRRRKWYDNPVVLSVLGAVVLILAIVWYVSR